MKKTVLQLSPQPPEPRWWPSLALGPASLALARLLQARLPPEQSRQLPALALVLLPPSAWPAWLPAALPPAAGKRPAQLPSGRLPSRRSAQLVP